MITNTLLSIYGITVEDLYDDVCCTAPFFFPATLKTMEQMLFDMTGRVTFGDGSPMYVATCNGGYFGAGVVFYPGFLDGISEKLDADLILLPSSVHEMIILPYDPSMNLDKLIRIVTEVNSCEVQPGDRLTDSVYYYDRETRYFSRIIPETQKQSDGREYHRPVQPS